MKRENSVSLPRFLFRRRSIWIRRTTRTFPRTCSRRRFGTGSRRCAGAHQDRQRHLCLFPGERAVGFRTVHSLRFPGILSADRDAPRGAGRRGRLRRRFQRPPNPAATLAAGGLYGAGHPAAGRRRLSHRGCAALPLPRHDARRGSHVDGRRSREAPYRPALSLENQQAAFALVERRGVAVGDQVASRTHRDRGLARRRFARDARLRQMGREIRRVLYAGRDARPDPLCRRAQRGDHPRARPAGAQPQLRARASRDSLRLYPRPASDGRLRLPLGVVRFARGELSAAGRYSGRAGGALPVGVPPYRRATRST